MKQMTEQFEVTTSSSAGFLEKLNTPLTNPEREIHLNQEVNLIRLNFLEISDSEKLKDVMFCSDL